MEKRKRQKSQILHSTPTFWNGSATVINLAGNFYDFSTYDFDFEADRKAIESDFHMIGKDIYNVIEKAKEDKKISIL